MPEICATKLSLFEQITGQVKRSISALEEPLISKLDAQPTSMLSELKNGIQRNLQISPPLGIKRWQIDCRSA